MEDFFVLGEDRRFDLLSEMLKRDHYRVSRTLSPTEVPSAYLFSLASSGDDVCSVLEKVPKKSFVLVGRSTPKLVQLAKEKDLSLVALLEDETYLLANSLATAEGTLSEVIRCTDHLLTEASILICGYGNCGRSLARLLWLCGGEVWVWSREGSMERARQDGFNTYRAPGKKMGMFDVIINTVPEPVFTEEFLNSIHPGTHFFQVASGLSGVLPDQAKLLGIHFHPLPGLPGRFAPATEAGSIYRVLNRTLLRSNHESE